MMETIGINQVTMGNTEKDVAPNYEADPLMYGPLPLRHWRMGSEPHQWASRHVRGAVSSNYALRCMIVCTQILFDIVLGV